MIARWFSFRLAAVVPLVIWTLFVWGTRLRNAADDNTLTGADRVQAFGTAGVFVVLALAVAVVVGLRRTEAIGPPERWVVGAAAAFTVVFWLVRMVTIAFGDHTLAFIAVHAVLGLGSIALSLVAVSALRADKAASGQLSSAGGE